MTWAASVICTGIRLSHLEDSDGKEKQIHGVFLGTGPVYDKVALRESYRRRTKGSVLGQVLVVPLQ